MDRLPQELGASIAVFLEADDLASATRTSHAVRRVFNDPRTWRLLYRRDTTPEVGRMLSGFGLACFVVTADGLHLSVWL
jgi:hypothetical protein